MYTKTFMAGWGDMDFNSDMKNTAYLDKSADVRNLYFAEHGFPMEEYRRLAGFDGPQTRGSAGQFARCPAITGENRRFYRPSLQHQNIGLKA